MIMQMFGLAIGLCTGYFLGLFVYEQMQLIAEKRRRRKMREELDRLFNDR